MGGLGVIGRDNYGVFPLKGKVLNVRDVTEKQCAENEEIQNLVRILGLKYLFVCMFILGTEKSTRTQVHFAMGIY